MYIYIYELVAFKTNWYYISNSDKTKPRKKNVYTLLKCFLYSNRNLKKKNVSFTKVADTTLPLGQVHLTKFPPPHAQFVAIRCILKDGYWSQTLTWNKLPIKSSPVMSLCLPNVSVPRRLVGGFLVEKSHATYVINWVKITILSW